MDEIKGTLFTKATIGAPCQICGQIIPGMYTGYAICNSCRDAILWAKKKMEAERIEKLNEKNRKEDEERWRKIMQGTL